MTRFLLGLALVALPACGLGGSMPPATSVRPASDLPGRFEPEDPTRRIQPGDTLVGSACWSPLLDPRDGTAIRFLRTDGPIGDYEVPAGRYGATPRTLLRVECNTGRPLGLVPR